MSRETARYTFTTKKRTSRKTRRPTSTQRDIQHYVWWQKYYIYYLFDGCEYFTFAMAASIIVGGYTMTTGRVLQDLPSHTQPHSMSWTLTYKTVQPGETELLHCSQRATEDSYQQQPSPAAFCQCQAVPLTIHLQQTNQFNLDLVVRLQNSLPVGDTWI